MDSMQFLQLIPRIRVYEKKLLDKAQIERMIDANTSEGALKVLQETEYAAFMNEVRRPDDYEILLSNELVRLYKTMYEASPLKEIIDVMALKYDYHNIKVLVKGLELDDSKNISAVSVHFKGIEPENILENIKKVLGEPKISKDKENGDSKVYSWEKDGYQYKLSQVGEETIITVNKSAI